MTPPTRPWGIPAAGHNPIRQWGTGPTPPEPKPKRRGPILLAAAIGIALLLVTTGVLANSAPPDTAPNPTPPTTPSPEPTDPPGDNQALPSDPPKKDPQPEPAQKLERVTVPTLAGMTRAKAKQTLADRGLKATTRSRSTDQYRAGTVISQAPKAGAGVLPDTTITLVVAKTPPAPPPPSPEPPPTTTPAQCDPSYPDVCLDPAAEEYDCAGGSGNGPEYVEGPIRVRPPDPFDLDGEGDGWGCESWNQTHCGGRGIVSPIKSRVRLGGGKYVKIRNWIVAGLSVAALVGVVGWAWTDTGQPDKTPPTPTTVTPPKVNHKSHSQSPPITEIPEYAQTPSRPSVSITCPPDGYGNEASFGGRWKVFTPRATIAIDYGDGRSYKTSRRSYFNSAYRHTYHMTGTFMVRIVLTDAAGQTVSDDCIVTVLPEPRYLPPSQYPPSYDPPRLPNGHIDHDWPSFPGPGSSSRPIQPYPALPGDPNDRDGDGVACEYGCKN